MKIQKLLTMSDSGLVRVQDFNDDDKKKFLNEEKFRKAKSRQGIPRQEADVYVIYVDDFDEMESQIKDSQSKIQSWQLDIQEKDKTIERLEKELSSIYSDHQKEMKDLEDEYNEEVKQLKKDLHEKDLEIERTKTKYEKEIGQIKEANLNHLNGIKKFDEEKHMLIKDHNEEVSQLKKKAFNPKSDMKISDHVSQAIYIKNRLFDNTLHHNDNLNRLDSIGLLKFIKGDLNEIKKDLKEDIQVFQEIAEYIESKDENIIDINIKEEEEEDSS